MVAHSRQSDRHFSSRLNWDPPPPHPQSSDSPLQASVLPPFWFWGGAHLLEREGVGGPIPTRGQTLWYYLGTY
jgi:hypothetical protein